MDPALARLVQQLDLEPLELNLFRGQSSDLGGKSVFGGQVIGQALVAATRTVDGRAPHSLPEEVPPRLKALVGTCLKKNPAERFADFGPLRCALAPIYEEVVAAKAPEQVVAAGSTAEATAGVK